MSLAIWYVSKYVALPGRGAAGGRGYFIMKELASAGHRIRIITSDSNHLANPPKLQDSYFMQESDGMQICWVKTLKYTVAKSLRRILSWIHFEWRLLWLPQNLQTKPDVIIVSSLSLLTILNGLRWRAKYKCRLIFEIRDIWPLTITEEGGFSASNPLVMGLAFIERLGYRYADEIVGTMPNLGQHVNHVLGYARNVHCIPMGIDRAASEATDVLPQDYSASYFPANRFIVAHVGSIGITNALDTFLQCAERMQGDERICFLIVGDGDLREAYRAQYAHLKNLVFAPKVPKTMVQSVLAKCHLLYFSVHVSRVWEYGQSLNKVTDYMMAGKPVIASYTGYPSMINEAGCGSYVPAGNTELLEQEILRYARMEAAELEATGKKGRAWMLQNRTYAKLADDYLKIMTSKPVVAP